MAERRMFAKTIIDSDAFLDMPLSSQVLYFHLSMRADDDGFVNQPKSIMRICGCKDDDMKMLFSKNFVIPFESGIVVIKHWKIHNYIRKDTYNETKYKEEKSKLMLDENNSYTVNNSNSLHVRDNAVTDTSRNRDVPLTQDRLGKDRLGKVSIDIDDETIVSPPTTKKIQRHKYGEYKNVLFSDDELEKLKTEFPDYKERIEKLSEYMASTGKSYKNHLATIRTWAKRDFKKPNQSVKSQSQKSTSYDIDEVEKYAMDFNPNEG